MRREKSNYLIQSVSHSIDVLEELIKASGEVGVTELSKRLKLHKNNVFRLLATLELRGFVEQNRETEDYRLGVRALQLGQAYLQQSTLVAKAQPMIKALADKLGETVSLAVLHSGEVQYPLSVESKRPVKVAARIATTTPAKMSAAGRLLTAQFPDSILQELLSGNTPQDAAIKSQLMELRSSGQIIDRGAIEPDVTAICKIVRGNRSEVVGAVEVVVPQYRAKIEQLVPVVEAVANELSQALGATKGGLIATLEKEIIREERNTKPMPNAAGASAPVGSAAVSSSSTTTRS